MEAANALRSCLDPQSESTIRVQNKEISRAVCVTCLQRNGTSDESVSCNAMHSLVHARGRLAVHLVDSSRNMCFRSQRGVMIGRRADGAVCWAGEMRVLKMHAQPLRSGGAGQRGRRNERKQSRRSEHQLCPRPLVRSHHAPSSFIYHAHRVITTMQPQPLQRRFFAGQTCSLGLFSDDLSHAIASKTSPYPTKGSVSWIVRRQPLEAVHCLSHIDATSTGLPLTSCRIQRAVILLDSP